MPATTDPAADPQKQLSHIYDNRARLETRVKLLQTGHRYSQEPASLMRRLVSNVEAQALGDGELSVESNFVLAELAIQAKHEMHWWVGRTTHRLRRVEIILHTAQLVGRAADLSVHLVLGLDGQLGQDEVRFH